MSQNLPFVAHFQLLPTTLSLTFIEEFWYEREMGHGT